MLDAIPSSEPASSCLKYRRFPNITSRSTSRLQLSPNASTAALIGHPERAGSTSRTSLPICLQATTGWPSVVVPIANCKQMTGGGEGATGRGREGALALHDVAGRFRGGAGPRDGLDDRNHLPSGLGR